MCLNANAARCGTVTTPTNWLIADNSSDAFASKAWVPAPLGMLWRRRAISGSASGSICNSESTNTR